jgi:tetratricopeptide (TPR) repeat protein
MGARVIAVSFLPLAFAIHLIAQDPLVSKGFDHFYNLEFDQAIADFSAATRQHPNDANTWNHLAQAILYQAMDRSGALESQLLTRSNPFLRREKVNTTPAEDKTFYDAINHALDTSRSRLQQDNNDAGALYTLGIAYGLRANYDFSVRKAWVDALREATSARKAHYRACSLEPSNVDARLIPSLFDYVMGGLPIGYRILGFLGGYHGDRQRGIATLETVAREGKSNRVDAQVLLAVIYRRERRSQEAIPLLQGLIREYPRSYLLSFEIVQMYSDVGDKQAALDQLQRIWSLHRQGAPGFAQLPPEKIAHLEETIRQAPQSEVSRESRSDMTKPYKRQEAN